MNLKIPNTLYRDGSSELNAADNTLRMSISSEEPYLRFGWVDGKFGEYYEVLDHGPNGCDMSRLQNGAALLFNHDRNVMLGTISAPTIQGTRAYGMARISDAEDIKDHRTRIREGILKDTSVGYSVISDGEEIGERDGIPMLKFRWAPHEVSLVTIPADASVGIGRERAMQDGPNAEYLTEKFTRKKNVVDGKLNFTDKRTTQPAMPAETEIPANEKETKIDLVRERETAASNGVAEFKARAKKINEFVNSLGNQPAWQEACRAIAAKHIDGEANYSAFHEEALRAFPTAQEVNPGQTRTNEGGSIGMSRKDRKRFSLARAILMANSREGLKGFESEVCEAAANLYYGKDNRQFSGLCIPDDVLRDNFAETHELGANQRQTLLEDQIRLAAMNPNSHLGQRALNVSTFSAGGALVGTDLLGGSLIDILRNAVLIGQGPMAVTELGGLVGNVAIPKQTGTTTVYWLAEGASVTESQETFAQLVLTPHRMGVYTGYTKQLLAQASISVEAFVRSDQAQAMAVEEDRVTIQGTGIGGEPTGILNTTGTLSNVTFSGAATWADMVALEYGLENANVRNGQMAILTSPLTKSYLKQTPVIAASTFPIFLWGKNEGFPTINGVMPGVVNEYPAYATKNMTNQMIQGVFSNLFKARWAGFDVVVDPYTGAQTETIKVFVNQWLDIGLRYPQSFNVTTDAPTAP